MIELIPAIDIIGGKCVRLTKGDYGQKTVYNDDPLQVAREFEALGFKRLHVVDLDGAKSKHVVNIDILRRITTETELVVDFGGGIKSEKDIQQAFENGAAMVTVGSLAVTTPDLFIEWMQRFGAERIILGADVRNGMISINGWKENSAMALLPFLGNYIEHGIKNVLCTEISKDGTLSGPATSLYTEIMKQYPQIHLIASGGISNTEDILDLKAAVKRKKLEVEQAIIAKDQAYDQLKLQIATLFVKITNDLVALKTASENAAIYQGAGALNLEDFHQGNMTIEVFASTKDREQTAVSTYQGLQTQITTDIITLEILTHTPILTNTTTDVTLNSGIRCLGQSLRVCGLRNFSSRDFGKCV